MHPNLVTNGNLSENVLLVCRGPDEQTHSVRPAGAGSVPNRNRSMHTCSSRDETALMGLDCFHAEPTPFTTSNHPFLAGNSNGLPSAFASTVGAGDTSGSNNNAEVIAQSELVSEPLLNRVSNTLYLV